MYDVKEGAVRVASLDVREVAQNCLRKAVAMVPQDVVLFNNTILFNVRWKISFFLFINIKQYYDPSRYGRADASQEEVEEAAKAAGIHDSIENFPDKWEMMFEKNNRGLTYILALGMTQWWGRGG